MAVVRQRRKPRRKGGTPAWIVTFADLATLLLTFFILLLSFAEMDVDKYRAMASSMAQALGSDRVVVLDAGGSPNPVAPPQSAASVTGPETAAPAAKAPLAGPDFIEERQASEAVTRVSDGILDLASRLIRELESEVASDTLSVNYDPRQVVIRFSEEATFRSGEAAIKPAMIPIIERVVAVLSRCSGDVFVTGHTDDRPIVSSRYRSNWDLSAARAVSVVHELVLNRQIPADRVLAAGRAETNPLVANDSPDHRALNRRVEIAIREPTCTDPDPNGEAPVEIVR
ncbi:OmpA family protein [Marinobacter salinisoli]|uniref:OmpA family protein n=1 Tax=Marinobacter salinisoli TaxID=2769486 RepID=A0ABX7MTE7_9GAMM|nr:flagellar motor protein MotB [Marinobacter salinisoli]QSP95596.1 OmpA family protein [Marinobacter salinisoli]